ncbi:MAG TPA: phosphoribosyltransferase family protein [Patescibacteria group bacterium]
MAHERVLENEEVLVTSEERNRGFEKAAKIISADYLKSGVKGIVLVGVLNGGVVTAVHLGEKLEQNGLDVDLRFIAVGSYGNSKKSSRKPQLLLAIEPNAIKGKHVLGVDDVQDGGYTLEYVRCLLNLMDPESLKLLVLATKEGNQEVSVKIDYSIFTLDGKKWLFGSGMDKDGKSRRLADFIGAVKENGQLHSS